MARPAHVSAAAFSALILEAGLVDYYATSIQGISGWCITPAYWLLIPTYGRLWLVGRWFALRHTLEGRFLVGLALTAWAASSFAFFSNTTCYMFSGYFSAMGAIEFAPRVAHYYGLNISVAMLYIACAVGIQMLADIIGKQGAQSRLI